MEEVGVTEHLHDKEEIIRAERTDGQGSVDMDNEVDEKEPEAAEKIIPGLPVKVKDEETVAEKVGERQSGTSKKVKHSPKQVLRPKPTIPQPFSLATEKRSAMCRQRRPSVDFSSVNQQKGIQERRKSVDLKESQPKRLHKSASLNLTKHNFATKVKENPNLKGIVNAARNLSRTKVASTESADEKIEQKCEQTKHKHQVKEMESLCLGYRSKRDPAQNSKKPLQKYSTMKASSLPNFYDRKDQPAKPEDKKERQVPATHSKFSPLGRQVGKSNTTAGSGNGITEDKSKNTRFSRTISSSAKETLSKLFKTTRQALAAPKATMKLSAVSKA